MLFGRKAEEDFNVEDITSSAMKYMVDMCERIYQGNPDWTNDDDHIKTINFAKAVCSEVSRLATLAIGVQIDGSSRADWLQEQIEKIYFNLRHWVEYGCAYGTIILKPNGAGIDMYRPDDVIITDQRNGEITGIVFVNKDVSGGKYYTRMEYHRFLDVEETRDVFGGYNANGLYAITNKCYVGDSETDIGKPISIDKTPWVGLMADAQIENIQGPLYGVLRTPHANNVDVDSPLSLPIFSDAVEELKDLDIAYSRNAKEIADSKRLVLLDSDRLFPSGGKVVKGLNDATLKPNREGMGLPDYVKNVYGDGQNNFYQEINPALNTDTRLAGINALLSQIGYKCGFSNGYFVFNETTGIQTATGVEAEQQRTIQLIKDVRDKLESCLDDLIYALNVFADLYDLAPAGDYEVTYDFGDITYNEDEDRARWWGYVTANKVPAYKFFMKFEGMSEEDARAMVEEAQGTPTLYGEDE